MLSRFRPMLFGLLIFVGGPSGRCEGIAPHLRIGLMQGRSEVSFSAPAGLAVHSLRGTDALAIVPTGETWSIRPPSVDPGQRGKGEGKALQLVSSNGALTEVSEAIVRLVPPEGAIVTIHGVEGHWDKRTSRDYRGVIEVISGSGQLTVVNMVDVENYLRGVVPSEMPATYPLSALQAQAVAARGQALIKAGRHRAEGFDLCSDQHCQVYGGATIEDAKADQAVSSTFGEVLVNDGRLADTLYSSNCGGHTANNEDYWPDAAPKTYLRGQPDFEPDSKVNTPFPLTERQARDYLKYAPPVNCNQPAYARTEKIRWWSVVRTEELEEKIREAVGDFGSLMELRVVDRAPSGLVRAVAVIGTRRLVKLQGGAAIRKALGGLNSASFAIATYHDNRGMPVAFAIWGAGWGHQVGMCQVGAAGLADRQWDYRQILSKYYNGCRLERRY